MVAIIVGVLALLFLQTLIAPLIQYLGTPGERAAGLRRALGPRDRAPPPPVLAGRADRALRNLFEALPVFLTLALLAVLLRVEHGLAAGAAAVFLAARVLYVPGYLWGPPGVRSAIWGVAFDALLTMAALVLRAAT
jgi:uncharacterized MAPEG superfamily protein